MTRQEFSMAIDIAAATGFVAGLFASFGLYLCRAVPRILREEADDRARLATIEAKVGEVGEDLGRLAAETVEVIADVDRNRKFANRNFGRVFGYIRQIDIRRSDFSEELSIGLRELADHMERLGDRDDKSLPPLDSPSEGDDDEDAAIDEEIQDADDDDDGDPDWSVDVVGGDNVACGLTRDAADRLADAWNAGPVGEARAVVSFDPLTEEGHRQGMIAGAIVGALERGEYHIEFVEDEAIIRLDSPDAQSDDAWSRRIKATSPATAFEKPMTFTFHPAFKGGDPSSYPS